MITSANISLDETTKQNVERWLTENYDEDTKNQIRELLKNNPQEVIDSFYTNLSFGTGGLRGIMGVGSNRMNPYTVRAATQGLANYLNKQLKKEISVLIGYDSRINSRLFAEETAKVLAANGIHAYLFEDLRPVPLISFGCRLKKCDAAVMITASHNPPQYNGYKVYWNDGGQVLPPHDQGMITEVNQITDTTQVKTTLLTHPLITTVGSEIDEAYIKAISTLQLYPEKNQEFGKTLTITYSSLHGTGITMVPKLLASWGFTQLHLVEKQKIPDGHFPTTPYPNPEEHAALKLGVEVMLETNSDLLLATDPDADRVGVVVNHHRNAIFLNGNQVACLCLEHICQGMKEQNKLPKKPAFVKTIVTTELFKAIAEGFGIPCFDVLTGFKYIAEKIHQWEQSPDGYQFIFGGEESYGYLLGTNSRDKDAVVSCALICEVALQAKLEKKTLVDKLNELYKKYGVYREKLFSLDLEESKAGKEQTKRIMQELRSSPPKTLLGTTILSIDDYQTSISTTLSNGKTTPLTLPKSNVLVFHLADDTKLVIRPSGTEPKIKLYCLTQNHHFYTLDEGIEHCDVLADEYLKTLKNQLMERAH